MQHFDLSTYVISDEQALLNLQADKKAFDCRSAIAKWIGVG